MVKAHPGWKAFLDAKGILSASAKNADLIEFALLKPQLAAQIEQILLTYAATAPQHSAAVLVLAARVEKLLAEYAAKKPRVRIKAISQAI